jgi:hypothetical protein
VRVTKNKIADDLDSSEEKDSRYKSVKHFFKIQRLLSSSLYYLSLYHLSIYLSICLSSIFYSSLSRGRNSEERKAKWRPIPFILREEKEMKIFMYL